MWNAIKILVLLLSAVLFAVPLVILSTDKKKTKPGKKPRFSLRYAAPDNRRNLVFVALAVLLLAAFCLLAAVFNKLAAFLSGLPIIGYLISSVVSAMSNKTDFILLALRVLLFNAAVLWGYLILKWILKSRLFDKVFAVVDVAEALTADTEEKTEDDIPNPEDARRNRNVQRFVHSTVTYPEDEQTEAAGESRFTKFKNWFWGLFFEGKDFAYGKTGTVRAAGILQLFVRLTEILYGVLMLAQLLSLLYPLPSWMYTFLMDWIQIDKWFMYPFLALIVLQELCNFWNANLSPRAEAEEKMEEETPTQPEEKPARLEELHNELLRKYDEDHMLRCFPEHYHAEMEEYQVTSTSYESALRFTRSYLLYRYGHVMENYMECLDALFNDNHVYVGAPFYSGIGEYLSIYTYIRLLAGYRMVYIVSDADRKESLRSFLNERLKTLTGTNDRKSWRIFTAEERLDQADILITTPEDFCEENIVDHYPDFFEEVCNAVLIDADRVVSMDSYRCPILAKNLMNATNHAIHFVFLTKYVLGGFPTATLPEFFCLDKVSNFSAAKENSPVAYYIWNLESKRRRIYNKGGQKLTSLECLVAEEACRYGVDGVRIWSSSPMEHADELTLRYRSVEINGFYKDMPEISYLIYTDDTCNLAAAMYVCTRFEGRKKSVAHILCKPYLLREYFMSRSSLEQYINRSSIIQPRVSSHSDQIKMSFLRIYCEACTGEGMLIERFTDEVKKTIQLSKQRQETPPCPWCMQNLEPLRESKYKLANLVAYFIAALCDAPDTDIRESAAKRSKDFYLVINRLKSDGTIDKYISFKRTGEVYASLFRHMKRVELRLHDERIGELDTFPERVPVEYIVGQSLIYNNIEYVIDRISEDNSVIFLRSENVTMRCCLDTFFLRRYIIGEAAQLSCGVWNFTRTQIRELRAELYHGLMEADTYGFYSLMSNNQTIDFYHGVEGVFRFEGKQAEKNHRTYRNGRFLKLTMNTRMTCTDGMRMLLSAVINELIRTIFPDAYKCVAFCPILEEPIVLPENAPAAPLEQAREDIMEDGIGETGAAEAQEQPAGNTDEAEADEAAASAVTDADKADIEARIRSMYPFLQASSCGDVEYAESVNSRMTFLLINDCREDVGILDWFSSLDMRYMCEFLSIVYSFLHWLDSHPEPGQYIYFGGDSLPACYDLAGCLKLLEGMNLVLSDSGDGDFETGSDVGEVEDDNVCSFCHKPVFPGRYYLYDNSRYICPHCRSTIVKPDELDEVRNRMLTYLVKLCPNENFRPLANVTVRMEGPYDLNGDTLQTSETYRVDFESRIIWVELDSPLKNLEVSVLRGLIELWQHENGLKNSYADAQLCYEELQYMAGDEADEAYVSWLKQSIPESIRPSLEELRRAVGDDVDAEPAPDAANDAAEEASVPEEAPAGSGDTAPEEDDRIIVSDSFAFMREMNRRILESSIEPVEADEEEVIDTVDPDKTPRFWKKFVLGMNPENDDPDDPNPPDETDEAVPDAEPEQSAGNPEAAEIDTSADTAEGIEPDKPAEA